VAPLLEEDDQTAPAHQDFVEATLWIYDLKPENLLFLAADNTNLNPCLARDMDKPFLGCHSHRYTLAVNEWLEEQELEGPLDQVNEVMLKLRTMKGRGRLRRVTHLAPKKRYEKRWSGAHDMLLRYFRLLAVIRESDPLMELVGDLLPDGATETRLKKALKDMKLHNSITIQLQREELTMAQARKLFETAAGLFPDSPKMQSRMAIHGGVSTKWLETGAAKLINGRQADLVPAEKRALEFMKVKKEMEMEMEIPASQDSVDVATRALNALDAEVASQGGHQYHNARILPPTTCTLERSFSKGKLIYTPQRQRLLPIIFEALMQLKINRKYWDAETVQEALSLGPVVAEEFECDTD
jgi:hypothetical protein